MKQRQAFTEPRYNLLQLTFEFAELIATYRQFPFGKGKRIPSTLAPLRLALNVTCFIGGIQKPYRHESSVISMLAYYQSVAVLSISQ